MSTETWDASETGLLPLMFGNLGHMAEIIRQQTLGDRELLVDIEFGRDVEKGHAVAGRICFLQNLAHELGLSVDGA